MKKHLPHLALTDAALAETLTIRDQLSHRPGIGMPPISMLDAFTGEITDARYFYWLAQARARGTPTCSSQHFTLLCRVVEAVAGKSWRDALDETLLRPAGPSRTSG